VVAVLSSLSQVGNGKDEEVADAIREYDLDPDAIEPRLA
jgi:pyruvate dehydrogenase complex dehydrogenase (E1) component